MKLKKKKLTSHELLITTLMMAGLRKHATAEAAVKARDPPKYM